MIFEARALVYVGIAGARTERSALDADVAGLADVYASLRATMNKHVQGEGGDRNMIARMVLTYKRKTSELAIADLVLSITQVNPALSHATPLAIAIIVIYCGIPRQERLCSINFAPHRVYHATGHVLQQRGSRSWGPLVYKQQVLA